MKIIIQLPDIKDTKSLERFVQKKIQKLEVIYDQILEARVCLKHDNSETNKGNVCEIRLVIPGNDLFASKQSNTFEESVMDAIDALRHQIEHLKAAFEKQKAAKPL